MLDRPVLLLVDDEPFNLDYLAQELEDLDMDILTATSGQDALRMVAEQAPDMIFLDIMMPGMNGFDVLQRLKSEPAWRHIPVVIISAASDLPQVVKGIELGADDFLPKPFEPVLLHARLNAGLEKKRLRDLEQRYLRLLESELEIGKEIQAGFLPQEIPQPAGWQIAAFFRSAREVAGDFYDVFEVEPGKLALLLGDVTDKGVGAALYMALFRSLLRSNVMMEQITSHMWSNLFRPKSV
jgi:sigma-B regulation protein RsbU (phosphoserine phosphatase)